MKKGLELIKTDRNGSKHYIDHTCPRCGGSGILECYQHVEAGVCFLCGGTGTHPHKKIVRTPEYEAILRERKIAKAKKDAPERNAKFFETFGLDSDGNAWIALGDTYSKREELKADGARYCDVYGWHYAEERPGTVKVTRDQTMMENYDGTYRFLTEAKAIVKGIRDENSPESKSRWIAKTGEKVEIQATLKNIGSYQTHFGYRTETVLILVFQDDEGNAIVWKTSSYWDAEEGKRYQIKGTVKSLDEYRGTKQTVLTRCKLA